MYLAKIEIKNFRNLRDFSMGFEPGLNVIVGENNAGKTNLFDAIRLVLSSGQGPRDIWARPSDLYHENDETTRATSFEIDLTFRGLLGDELGWFSKCLSPQIGDDAAQIHLRFEIKSDAQGRERRKTHIWGGETEGDTIESEVLESLRVTFLPALRDAGADLRPGRNTRVSRLLKEISEGEPEQEELVEQVKAANENIRHLPLVARAKSAINDNLQSITGPSLAQVADLALTEPSFERVTDTMRALIGTVEPLEMSENGLGYNNLLYIATVLSELQRAKDTDLRVLLIEEPEAHLHPQLQVLLVDHLLQQAHQSVQVLVSSHSPTLASRVPVDRITVMHRARTGEKKGKMLAKPIRDCGLDEDELQDLRRYLDITKSTLLFARGVILLEGISEALLLPILARQIKVKVQNDEEHSEVQTMPLRLADYGIAMVNMNGLAFRPFAKLFQEGNLDIPCALVSDGDPQPAPEESTNMSEEQKENILFPTRGQPPRMSATAQTMIGMQSGQLKVFLAHKTFEYDLALEGNAGFMATVYKGMNHPNIGERMLCDISEAETDRDKAKAFFTSFRTRDKARFAQRLALALEPGEQQFSTAAYLVDAIRHVTGVYDGQTQDGDQ